MLKHFILSLILSLNVLLSFSQELNCRFTVNSDQIQGTNKQIFQSLESALNEFINDRKWSDAKLTNVEKIECSFVLIIKEVDNENYKGELQVQSKRPVYNASYTSTMFNFRDQLVEFPYREFEPLQFNPNNIDNNLTATIAFYVYLLLGIDFDSFSPYGGTPFYQQAQSISVTSMASNLPGWSTNDGRRARTNILNDFIDEASKPYRDLWYTYHRHGLDEMSTSVEKGRLKIASILPTLKEVRSARPMGYIITLFADAKLDEIAEIFSKSATAEKQSIYKLLQDLYPTHTSRYESLRN
ncbi:MAG: DUF4835 family protein [Bacteroidales bacterium]